MNAILIDTNLLVYLHDHNEPIRQPKSQTILNKLQQLGTGRLSVQCLAEFFSVSTRKLTPPLTPTEALQQIRYFSQIWPVFDLTGMIGLEAGRGVRDYQFSYFDAQIWATARLNQIPVVFSEDFNDGAIVEDVQFVNPFSKDFDLNHWTSG